MPQKLPEFTVMRLKDASRIYLHESLKIGDRYIFMGELRGVPGHVLVFNYSKGVMVPGILHPEQFEPVPLEEL